MLPTTTGLPGPNGPRPIWWRRTVRTLTAESCVSPSHLGSTLSDVASAPRTRRLNLAQVKSVVLFVHNLEKPQELLVQELRLVP